MKPTYSELLRDPRWQKMRLKVIEADELLLNAFKFASYHTIRQQVRDYLQAGGQE